MNELIVEDHTPGEIVQVPLHAAWSSNAVNHYIRVPVKDNFCNRFYTVDNIATLEVSTQN